MTRHGHIHTYISCALAGDSYEVDGKVEVDFHLDAAHPNCSVAHFAFEQATGASADQWEKWYNERIYKEDPMDAYITGWQ